MPLGISVLGRRRKVSTRKPGDLPSAVVTREDVGRGVQALASPELLTARWWDLVRCDVPLTSYRGLNYVFHNHSREAAPPFLAGFHRPRADRVTGHFLRARAAIRFAKLAATRRGRSAAG